MTTSHDDIPTPRRAADGLARLADLWQARLDTGWTPPPGGSFPWPMVRVPLHALLPGLRDADRWRRRADPEGERYRPRRVALVLAGNTPLLAWPALAACVLAGSGVSVKMSRDETLWPRLFVESLAEVDSALAALISLDVWPGDASRTVALVQSADAVIAYGSDASLATLRAVTPGSTPFFGFGHAVSVGVGAGRDEGQRVRAFARDILMYDQGGCLSPHAVFVEGDAADARAVAGELAGALPGDADALGVGPVTDPGVARTVRQARDLALFTPGATVRGDAKLRWTAIALPEAEPLSDAPVGHGVVTVMPVADLARDFGPLLGAARGRVSSVGVAGTLRPDVHDAVLAEGVSRVCAAGTMQSPPLDWPNGGRDLLAELLRLSGP